MVLCAAACYFHFKQRNADYKTQNHYHEERSRRYFNWQFIVEQWWRIDKQSLTSMNCARERERGVTLDLGKGWGGEDREEYNFLHCHP